MRLKWYMGERPTGPYRSFQRRAWPTAEYKDGRMAAYLIAEDRSSYRPSIKETTKLIIRIADHKEQGFDWVQLKSRPVGLTAAKAIVNQFLKGWGEAARDPTRRLK